MYWYSPYWCYPIVYPEPGQNTFPSVKEAEEIPQKQEIQEVNQRQKKQTSIFNRLLKVELDRKEQNNFRKNWTADEEKTLLQMREMGHSWENISLAIQDSTPVKCMRRYERIVKNERKWPKQVDQHIIQKHQVEGLDWHQVRTGIQEYTSKEIRMRYINYLRPGIDLQKWEFEEDLKLIQIVAQHSRRWKTVAQFFPNRSELQVKNRYSRTLQPSIRRVKKKLSKIQKNPKRKTA